MRFGSDPRTLGRPAVDPDRTWKLDMRPCLTVRLRSCDDEEVSSCSSCEGIFQASLTSRSCRDHRRGCPPAALRPGRLLRAVPPACTGASAATKTGRFPTPSRFPEFSSRREGWSDTVPSDRSAEPEIGVRENRGLEISKIYGVWRTASRSSSHGLSRTGPRRPRCAPTNCASPSPVS